VGRVAKHVEKALRIASFASDRIAAWDGAAEQSLLSAQAHLRSAVENLTKAHGHVGSLFEQGWVPPKKSMAATFVEGEEVMIGEKYRKKYLQIYAAAVIDNLVVAKCLDTGEIAVRHGGQTPFMVAKSHVEKRRVAKVVERTSSEAQASR